MGKPSKEVLKVISGSMKLSGFSGKISKKTADYVPDMREIAKSAKQFGAQIPRADAEDIIDWDFVPPDVPVKTKKMMVKLRNDLVAKITPEDLLE
jgi:hypothetical protein